MCRLSAVSEMCVSGWAGELMRGAQAQVKGCEGGQGERVEGGRAERQPILSRNSARYDSCGAAKEQIENGCTHIRIHAYTEMSSLVRNLNSSLMFA